MQTRQQIAVLILAIAIAPACQTTTVENREPASTVAWPTNFEKSQNSSLVSWAEARKDEIEKSGLVDPFTTPTLLNIKSKAIKVPTVNEIERLTDTTKLYFEKFGQNSTTSFIGTGVESGNNQTKFGEYRWNSLKEEGFYNPEKRRTIARKLVESGITTVRLGMSNHDIVLNNEKSWKTTTEIINDLHAQGLKIILDLHHFGIESRFKTLDKFGNSIPAKSYYLNPAWPDYFAQFAKQVVKKYGSKISGITIINEPETVATLSGEMWNGFDDANWKGAFPGVEHKDATLWYLKRAFQIAKASVKARIEIEKYVASVPTNKRPHFLFFHVDSLAQRSYDSEYNLYRRYLLSDLILGSNWLIDSDLSSVAQKPLSEIVPWLHVTTPNLKTNFQWVVENYVVYNQEEARREQLRQEMLADFTELKNLHSLLQNQFGKTMRTDTVFAGVYFAQSEARGHDGKKFLNPEPQYYADQVKSGDRVGLYSSLVDFFNRYHIPMSIGGTGTLYHDYAPKWHEQMLFECATAANQGIPLLSYTIFPAVDTWGWETALSVPRDQAAANPNGVLASDGTPRPFIKQLMEALHQQFSKESTAISNAVVSKKDVKTTSIQFREPASKFRNSK